MDAPFVRKKGDWTMSEKTLQDAAQIGSMQSGETWTFISHSPAETAQIAQAAARTAKSGDVFCLDGDLGAGKTFFSQAFGAALGITEPIVSPTFTIVSEYDGGRLPMYHFDVYRIEEIEEMDEIGFEEYVYGAGVTLIEWACRIEEILPQHRYAVNLTRSNPQNDSERRIEICRY